MSLTAILFIWTVGLLLSGCDQVPIEDEIWYGNKGMLGAVEFHTFTKDQRNVSFEEWMKTLRENALICTSVKSFGDVKKELEQLCSVCNCCNADMTKAVDQFYTNVTKASASVPKP